MEFGLEPCLFNDERREEERGRIPLYRIHVHIHSLLVMRCDEPQSTGSRERRFYIRLSPVLVSHVRVMLDRSCRPLYVRLLPGSSLCFSLETG